MPARSTALSPRRLLIASFVLLVIAFSWRPRYPDQLLLQHLPTVGALIALAVVARRPGLTTPSFCLVLAFLSLHVIGARWIYSLVPYDAWSEAVLGTTLSDAFGWERNHYDRFVHLAFGVLLVAPTADVLRRVLPLGVAGPWVLATVGIIAAGCLYELAEWTLAVTIAPESAERYLGQQGDPWDAQKDMALATVGAAAVAVAGWGAGRWRLRRSV